jgi:hypothetical protein
MEAKGCIHERVQYTYWPHASHGDCLFNIFKLRDLDRAIREQERTFRPAEATPGRGDKEEGPLLDRESSSTASSPST